MEQLLTGTQPPPPILTYFVYARAVGRLLFERHGRAITQGGVSVVALVLRESIIGPSNGWIRQCDAPKVIQDCLPT
ncbi:UNVERIFIED_CONTAM: hypothetical protein Sradi_3006600 [Sesamum radiatum]|uniref:Uncharacterized protein n=1 Tax=Sesamum radiatum TaxID=300843 RepID=A0AAW2S192_SESRA